MAFPESYAGAVSLILTGRHVATVAPRRLGLNVIGRRILLVANAGDVAFVVANGQPASGGFPIPQIQADGGFTPLELWVNNIQVIWIAGASGNEVVNWFVEQL